MLTGLAVFGICLGVAFFDAGPRAFDGLGNNGGPVNRDAFQLYFGLALSLGAGLAGGLGASILAQVGSPLPHWLSSMCAAMGAPLGFVFILELARTLLKN